MQSDWQWKFWSDCLTSQYCSNVWNNLISWYPSVLCFPFCLGVGGGRGEGGLFWHLPSCLVWNSEVNIYLTLCGTEFSHQEGWNEADWGGAQFSFWLLLWALKHTAYILVCWWRRLEVTKWYTIVWKTQNKLWKTHTNILELGECWPPPTPKISRNSWVCMGIQISTKIESLYVSSVVDSMHLRMWLSNVLAYFVISEIASKCYLIKNPSISWRTEIHSKTSPP